MTLRIIQAGLGGWGRDWAKSVVSKNKDIELVACVDTDPGMLELARGVVDIAPERCFTTLEEALATVEADAVLITALLGAHLPLAITALNAGKHVLVEKPFGPTIAEAREVVELAEQQRRTLFVSQNYRFYPAAQAVRDLLQKGELGEVGSVYLDFRRYSNTAPVETHRHYHIWEPLLVDMSIHHFDLMRMILGQEPTHITCQTWNPSWSNFDAASTGAATITFDGGAIVNYRGSWVSPATRTSWGGEWRIECAKGTISMVTRDDEVPDSVTIQPLEGEAYELELPTVSKQDRHGTLDAFVQAVREGRTTSDISGLNNLFTLALMFAAVESAEKGQPVEIA
ncbi:Gfo/Idh/MocA family protein [Ktedonospora formicarum]|uniref:Dehydrogenase n=1 Tax=Ktedonospora formicarum TaxID=2778364 RepID=A0A8J3MRN3_9CHLR|nr:Gfo/Idh/MocA family oxidoreductase [Ktedonospora formicarum]GHO42440.1 dehydrogenase [Ktedonospora formicarum]